MKLRSPFRKNKQKHAPAKQSLAPSSEPSAPAEFAADFREAIWLSQYYLESGDPASLERNVNLLERIRSHSRFPQTSSEFRALVFNENGAALNRRYDLFGNPRDLDVAVCCWEEAVRLAPPGRLSLFSLNNLATGLRAQYFQTGDRTKLNRAIMVLQTAIEQTEEDSPDLPARLNNLGNAFNTRWEAEGDSEDLEKGQTALEQAIHLTPIYSPDLQVRLNNLARLFLRRYELSGDPDNLTQAIEAAEQAVYLSPVSSLDMPLCLGTLGIGLLYRYDHENNLEDLQKGIAVLEEAIRRCPDSAPEMAMYFSDLANGLMARYGHAGDFQDLLRSVEELEKAVHLTPVSSPELPRYLNNLTLALRQLYVHTGHLEILEKAIAVGKEAVEYTPSDSPELSPRLSNLADNLIDRYGRRAELHDLQQAIEIYHDALRRTSVGLISRPVILNSLALSVSELARAKHDLEGIDRAVELLKLALQESPSEAAVRPMFLNNLGALLSERHTFLHDPVDLEQAIALGEEAVTLTAPDSPNGPMYRLNLADDLHTRYSTTNDVDLLRKAMDLCDEALKYTAPDSSSLARVLGVRGRFQVDQYALTNCEEDLRKAIDMHEKALAILAKSFMLSPPIYQLGGPQRDLTAVHAGAVLAFCKAALVWPSEAGKWIIKAMAAVEATKSRLLTTLLARREIPAPSILPDHLIKRERALVEELALLESQALARHSLPRPQQAAVIGSSSVHSNARFGARRSITLPDLTDEPDHLGRWNSRQQELQELLQEMEKYDGAADYIALSRGDYLSAQRINQLSTDLGETTALLSLSMGPEVTQLFAVCSAWIQPCVSEISLDENQRENLFSRFGREIHSFDGTGRRGETWPEILRPLLTQLTPHMTKIKHVVVVPYLGTHLLPWGVLASHAGWEVSVSTVPALAMLDRIFRQPELPVKQAKVLVLGNPRGDLPHAANEAMQVAELFNTKPLIGHLANKETVLKQLAGDDVQLAHFATHAYFEPGSPLDSGVVLADGVLTAREILERGLRAPRFVVLSACQSGMATPIAGEEMAGLSQVFMAAGTRSQLLSLWVVNDPATEYLMTGFYREWKAGQTDKATALKKAMAATRTALPAWAHTYYWGAFTLVGDWR